MTKEKIKILIVDDDEDIVLMMCDFLELLNDSERFTVSKAMTASLALSEIETNTPHVLITDITMPGTDGFKLAECLKTKNPSAYIVIMSGWSQQAADDPRYKSIDSYLKKPFELDTFESLLKNILTKFNSTENLSLGK